MVYESDYTTRRVYSGSRPGISTSYSYSPEIRRWSVYDDESDLDEEYYSNEIPQLPIMAYPASIPPYEDVPAAVLRRPDLFMAYAPGYGKGRKQHRVILPVPRMVHQRLIQVSAPPRRHRATNVYEALDFGRSGNQYVLVNYRTPSPPPVPRSRVMYIEDVTNSNFDEISRETRSMQRDMDDMLYRVSRGRSTTPISHSLYNMHHIPLRSASEVKEVADMRRLHVRDRNPGLVWNPLGHPNAYRMPLIYQPDPLALTPKYYYIGRQNLACLSFAGGRPIPKRRRFYPGYEDKVLDDVTFRSFYSKLRNAANIATNAAKAVGRRAIYQPIHYSRKTIFGENAEPKREIKESKWVQRALANEKEPVPRKNKEEEAKPVKRDSVKLVSGARRESLTKEPKPEPPAAGRPINVTLPGPRKSVTEIIKEDMPRVENLPEESITVRRPSNINEAPSTPVEAKAEETFKLPIKPKEPTPPPREPTPPPREPTPPPKEPTPPPKEPTPPPKEPTPPPREPTPPPREPTPPPPEPEVEAAPVEEVAGAEAAQSVEVSAADEKTGEAEVEGQVSEEGSNKGEVEEFQLDEEVTLDEVCEVQVEENDLEIEEDDVPAENGPVEVVAETEAEPDQVKEAQDDNYVTNDNVADAQDPETNHVQSPVVDEETNAGVSIHVADIDGPVEVDPEQGNNAVQEPMTVEQIQAEAERRRAEFARLLEEHHDIVEKVELLEHQSDDVKLEPVPEESSPSSPAPPIIENQPESQPQPEVAENAPEEPLPLAPQEETPASTEETQSSP